MLFLRQFASNTVDDVVESREYNKPDCVLAKAELFLHNLQSLIISSFNRNQTQIQNLILTKPKTTSVTTRLYDLPPPLIGSVIERLLFEDIVRLVDFIMLSNTRGRDMWHAQIKRSLTCPDMDKRRYCHESLRWVLNREITIKNFTTMELEHGLTELHYALCLLE